MNDLTAFRRDLLFALAGMDNPNGLELKAEIEEYYDEEIEPGRLYPNLDDLVMMGLIIKRRKTPRENEYELSKRGRRELEARQAWTFEHVQSLISDSPVASPSE